MRKPLFLEGSDMNNYSLYPDTRAVVNHCMPSTFYALEGRQINVYWDSILEMPVDVNNLPPEYRIDVVCTKGRQYENKWTYTPTSGDVGTTSWVLNVYYQEILIKKITCSLVTVATTKGTGVTRNVIILGDSTTAYGGVPSELINIFNVNTTSPASGGDPDAETIALVGTVKTAYADAGGISRQPLHEGRNGWTITDYVTSQGDYTEPVDGVPNGSLTNWLFDNWTANDLDETATSTACGQLYYTVAKVSTTITLNLYKDSTHTTKVASGTREGNGSITFTPESGYAISGSVTITYAGDTSGTWKLNPFWRNGELNFTKYMSDNSFTLNSGDWVMIHLGINDVRYLETDATLYPAITTFNTHLDTLIANIHAYSADVKIGVLVPIASDVTQDGFNTVNQRRYTRNRHKLAQSIVSTVQAKAVTNVYCLPYHINLDTVNNYPQSITTPNDYNVSSIMLSSDSVHPANIGFYQMASILKANIKAFEA